MEPGEFETIPTLHVERRRLVAPGSLAPLGDASLRPADRLRALAAKSLTCIVDHDGLQRNKADLDTLRRGAEKGNVWGDAGSRFATDAMDILVAGAERITLRWATLASEEELREAAALSDSVVLGLEFNHKLVANPLLPADEAHLLSLARELELGIAVIDLAREGTDAGFDRSLAGRFESTGLRRWFSGGVRGRDEARELEAMGYAGCLVDAARLEEGFR